MATVQRKHVMWAGVAGAGVVLLQWWRRVDEVAPRRRLARLGVVADVQYADVDDASNFRKTVTRHYRNVIPCLREAVHHFNTVGVDCLLNLGDIIDQRNTKGGKAMSLAALNTVLAEFAQSTCRNIVHVIGNHECVNFTREELGTLLKSVRPNHRGYYTQALCPRWTCIVLDAYDISMDSYGPEDARTKEAFEMCQANNPNDLFADGVDYSKGLTGIARRWNPNQGAYSEEQLAFLEESLSECDARGNRAMVLSHVAVSPEVNSPSCVVWNYDAALRVLHRHPSASVVLCGHDHKGGFCTDERGLHHVTLSSPLECAIGSNAFGVIDVFQDRVLIHGHGTVPSRDLTLRKYGPPRGTARL